MLIVINAIRISSRRFGDQISSERVMYSRENNSTGISPFLLYFFVLLIIMVISKIDASSVFLSTLLY